ncbi:uncharacterized protein LOC126605818 [Malus sylvestris]|uniref:uncharacterized protein LOC126605818 n=1 Tax=Malus sylvestris TaxID=3752 RepID=UPI0021ABED48|nr:uncharacterized protein LOC126605818 [Malus sylvestris]
MVDKRDNGYPPTKHKSTMNMVERGRSKPKCKGPRLIFSQPYPTHKVKQKYAELMLIPNPNENHPRLIPPSIDDEESGIASCTSLWCTSITDTGDFTKSRNEMAEVEIEELVVHLERNMDFSTMEHGVKLVGKVLANKTLNKWGVRNILRSSWKGLGEIDIKWVKDNTFIITVQDESTAINILKQVLGRL